jgi:riboflavin kinase/FMN adenylyltransferase
MEPSVVVIGNFDGVHRGHQAVLRQARALADARSLRCVVLTFDPHPAEVLGRGAPPRLTTLATRIELLRAHGATDVTVEPFTMELAACTPEQFACELLAARLGARAVVVGRNFRFGHKRAGDFDALRELGAAHGFEAVAAEVAGDDDGPFSSTRVRDAVAAGEVERAAHVLGRRHALRGTVEHGDARGRTLGFPTANLGRVGEMLPAHGVYAVRAQVEASGAARAARGGVMNLGVRPTVDGMSLRVEVHLFDFEGDIYGQTMGVELVSRIREERKFAGIDALKAQIATDAQAARDRL